MPSSVGTNASHVCPSAQGMLVKKTRHCLLDDHVFAVVNPTPRPAPLEVNTSRILPPLKTAFKPEQFSLRSRGDRPDVPSRPRIRRPVRWRPARGFRVSPNATLACVFLFLLFLFVATSIKETELRI